MILDGSTIFMSNLLFAGLALLLGMSFCIRHWVSNGLKTTQPTRFRRNRIIHNSLFSTWTNLAFLCRMLSLYGIVLVMSSNHVDMEIFGPYRYWVLVLLLALFFQQWNDLALFYRCRLWVLSSLLVVSTLALIFAQVELHNYAKYDRLYLQEQQARYEYIDRELNRALQWGIQYDDETLRTIHFKKSTRTIQWQEKIIDHLNDPNKPMDLKTLILHKIFVHNFYYGKMFHPNRTRGYRPLSLYHHLSKLDPSKHEREIGLIFEIINEYDLVFNAKNSFTKQEFQSLNERQYNRYEQIFTFTREWPAKWEEFKYLKHIENRDPNEEWVDLGTIMDHFPDLFDVTNGEIREEIKTIKDSLINNRKYTQFCSLLEDSR